MSDEFDGTLDMNEARISKPHLFELPPGRRMELLDWYNLLKRHALENYNTDGWDYFVECWTFQSLINEHEDLDTGARAETFSTYEELRDSISKTLKLLDSHRRDIQGTAF